MFYEKISLKNGQPSYPKMGRLLLVLATLKGNGPAIWVFEDWTALKIWLLQQHWVSFYLHRKNRTNKSQ